MCAQSDTRAASGTVFEHLRTLRTLRTLREQMRDICLRIARAVRESFQFRSYLVKMSLNEGQLASSRATYPMVGHDTLRLRLGFDQCVDGASAWSGVTTLKARPS